MAGRAEGVAERRVWDLLTRDFLWEAPEGHPVKVLGSAAGARCQLFEVVVTSILARMRPDFVWHVTANQHDGGLDFKGELRFLDDEALGISAAVTVGGQCKKRSSVGDVLDEIAGSVLKMSDRFDPTFIVVALSARVARRRVDEARATIERQCRRHCHVLDRAQIEGLLGDHLETVVAVLRQGLTVTEIADVLRYVESVRTPRSPEVSVVVPERVLAGVPFRVEVEIRSTIVVNPLVRLRWRPSAGDSVVSAVGPVRVDAPDGVLILDGNEFDDPLRARRTVELVAHAPGAFDVGEVVVGGPGDAGETTVALGRVAIVDNVRPRFFARPVQAGLDQLAEQLGRAGTGKLGVVGVVGSGGSGKSRLCEEFGLDRRRRGAVVVGARQTKSHDAPLDVVTDLLLRLATRDVDLGEPSERVLHVLAGYDRPLADAAAPSIRAAFGRVGGPVDIQSESALVSALLVFLTERSQRAPVIVHLQDLHWCGVDALALLDRLLWRLEDVLPAVRHSRGVLVLLEGRIREVDEQGHWSSAPFEELLRNGRRPIVRCTPLDADDRKEFVERLFEARHSASRVTSDELLPVRDELIERIDRSAGSNPFHVLEQVQLLKERRVLGQNPSTGLLFLTGTPTGKAPLPATVFASIESRWRYLQRHEPELALLVWGCALIEDRIPVGLFRRLRARLAPNASIALVDGTDILWTGDPSGDVVFRHEHHFEALRRFEVAGLDRDRIVDAYCDWFEAMSRPGPTDRFRWARALLERAHPDVGRARVQLETARRAARRRGDQRLERLAKTLLLDLSWQVDDGDGLDASRLLRMCDEEMLLARDLLASDRSAAAARIDVLRARLDRHLAAVGVGSTARRLEARRLAAEVLHAELLFNDRRPESATSLASAVLARLEAGDADVLGDEMARDLEMAALHVLACGQALSGRARVAVDTSRRAAAIARTSSSPLAVNVISTFGNILIVEDPAEGEAELRALLGHPLYEATRDHLVEVHLSMCLVLQAYRTARSSDRTDRLAEAQQRLDRVFRTCRRLGQYPDAGAAALMRGVVAALEDDASEVGWFSEAVAAASRGGQTETSWRAHINLASALARRGEGRSPTALSNARAALELIQDSLSGYADPELSSRFGLVRLPLEMAVRYLVIGGAEEGFAALEAYPSIRAAVFDPDGSLDAGARAGDAYYEWLAVDDVSYVLY